ncbi:BamA/TamA family outer membrane protein [Bacteroidota bacterium]
MKRAIKSIVFLFFWILNIGLFGQDADALKDSQLIINEIVVEGNKVTKKKIILRELVFIQGDTIEKIDLLPEFEQSRENLLNLSIFNFVSLDARHHPEGQIDVIIKVTERWYIWPTPIFEFADRNFSSFLKDPDWTHTNYGLWLKWNNFRGRNEMLSAKIRLGYKEQYLLEYAKPNIGINQNHKIAFGYSFMRQHRVNYRTFENQPVYYKKFPEYALNLGDGYLEYTFRQGHYTKHKIKAHYLRDWLGDSVSILNPDYFGGGRDTLQVFKLDYVFTHDVRDSKVYPLEGHAFKVKGQRFGFGLIKDYPYKNWILEGTSYYHKKLSNSIYVANISRARISSNKEVPLIQQKALGYNVYMTGYEHFIIDGTDFLITKFITKFQLLKPTSFQLPLIRAKQFNKVHLAIYLNVLADIGYVNNKFPDLSGNNYMENELQYSAGIGLDFVTYYDKVFRMEYAINRYGFHGFFFHLETPFFRW